MKALTLYTTAGCHLCEEAELILRYCQQYEPAIQWQAVDIANDPALVEQYGVRIPVIRKGDAELGWPFDPCQVMAFWKQGRK